MVCWSVAQQMVVLVKTTCARNARNTRSRKLTGPFRQGANNTADTSDTVGTVLPSVSGSCIDHAVRRDNAPTGYWRRR